LLKKKKNKQTNKQTNDGGDSLRSFRLLLNLFTKPQEIAEIHVMILEALSTINSKKNPITIGRLWIWFVPSNQ